MQTLNGGVGNFIADIFNAVVFNNGKLADVIGHRHFLRDAYFKFLEAVAADTAAEAHNGGFADLRFLSQVDNAHVHNLLGRFEHVLGDLHFRLTQSGNSGSNFSQNRTLSQNDVSQQFLEVRRHRPDRLSQYSEGSLTARIISESALSTSDGDHAKASLYRCGYIQ